jgi:hypothetical protein
MSRIPVRLPSEQLVLIEPGLDQKQVQELFADFVLKADRDGLFVQPKPKETAP